MESYKYFINGNDLIVSVFYVFNRNDQIVAVFYCAQSEWPTSVNVLNRNNLWYSIELLNDFFHFYRLDNAAVWSKISKYLGSQYVIRWLPILSINTYIFIDIDVEYEQYNQ